MDINEIMKILPHRYPFLLVDRIDELEPGRKAVGIKNVTINEGFFQGHFPGHPVMPGVLILESMAQVGGILAFISAADAVDLQEEADRRVVYFMSIDKVKFRRPVVPGDQLRHEVSVLKLKGSIVHIDCKTYVGEQVVAQAEMKAMLIDRDKTAGRTEEGK